LPNGDSSIASISPLVSKKQQPLGPGNDVLNQVLDENKGLARVHNMDNTQVMYASPERIKAAFANGSAGGLEYWPANEKGMPQFPHPLGGGKNVLEIYDNELKSNSAKLKNAIYGDLIHGMVNDPTWSNMREQFKSNYTPQEMQRIKSKQSWWDDANGKDANDMAVHDAYIRGWLNDSGRQGQQHYGGTMYSPKQLQLLEQMKNYIRTGKLQNVTPVSTDMMNPSYNNVINMMR
jgi:hypothetical protein